MNTRHALHHLHDDDDDDDDDTLIYTASEIDSR